MAPTIDPEPAAAGAQTRIARWIATVAGVGHAPVAPGTFGSAAAVPIFVFVSPFSPMLYAVTVVGIFGLGTWAAERAGASYGKVDDGRIVIDEVVGQLLAWSPLLFLPVCGTALASGAPSLAGCALSNSPAWLAVVTGFVLFRVFDVWKPGVVRWLERSVPGGLGVMLDDVAAGVLAALVFAGLLLWLGPGGAVA